MKKTGCLLIHGFAGSRKELEPLRRCLEQQGYVVSVPVLKGHEGTKREFGKSRRREWIASAKESLDELQKFCEKVVVVGFSMGGLVAANLCGSAPVDGVVFLNTPVYYWDIGWVLKSHRFDLKTYFGEYIFSGRNLPLHALLEFRLLLDATKRLFSRIACTVLVLQSMDDDVVVPESAQYIYSHVKGPKKIKRLPSGGHAVLQGKNAGTVCGDVLRFMEGI
ncbi:MAG: alpha/beta fold hydrolase [Clostridia bacterium]|nr:alpha/beta fold hydrolase [Clostridia bacterium]